MLARHVLGVGYKVHSDGNTSYYTRDEEGTLVAERAPGGSDYYYFQDALGSVMAMTDPSAGVANSYKYDPYGDIVSQTETTPIRQPLPLRRRALQLNARAAQVRDALV